MEMLFSVVRVHFLPLATLCVEGNNMSCMHMNCSDQALLLACNKIEHRFVFGCFDKCVLFLSI